MMRWFLALSAIVVALIGAFCVIIIDVREQAFRTVLGDPDFEILGLYKNQAELIEPGFYVRIPGLHQVHRFDRRRLHYDARTFEGFTSEKLLIEVDYYAIWKIDHPRTFYENFPNMAEAIKRLDDSTYSKVQETIPKNSLSDLLSERREEIIRSIAQAANDELRPLGIAILDLRIRRTDYPESNLKKIFDRMRTERNRFALKYRAEGEEQALEIRSKADREGLVIQANAERASTRLHGEGDAEATRIYAEAYNQDAEFYGFLRSLEAYRKALDDQTTMVLSKDAPFLKHLFDPGTTSKKRR